MESNIKILIVPYAHAYPHDAGFRQSRALRYAFLRSIMKQDIAWFDSNGGANKIIQVCDDLILYFVSIFSLLNNVMLTYVDLLLCIGFEWRQYSLPKRNKQQMWSLHSQHDYLHCRPYSRWASLFFLSWRKFPRCALLLHRLRLHTVGATASSRTSPKFAILSCILHLQLSTVAGAWPWWLCQQCLF